MRTDLRLLLGVTAALWLAGCMGPVIRETAPPPGSTAPVDATLSATFNAPIDPRSLPQAFLLASEEGLPVPGAVTYDEKTRTATFVPRVRLSYGADYTATITDALRDRQGNRLAHAHRWSFMTQKAQVRVSWTPNGEPDVNQPGGGYRVYYATIPQAELGAASVIDVPYREGRLAPFAVVIPLSRGTYYIRVVAYTHDYPAGSDPSEEVSIRVH